jgi:hypothetical protein
VDHSHPGTTKLSRLEENIGAIAVELTSDDLHEIDSAASKITSQGISTPKPWKKGSVYDQPSWQGGIKPVEMDVNEILFGPTRQEI